MSGKGSLPFVLLMPTQVMCVLGKSYAVLLNVGDWGGSGDGWRRQKSFKSSPASILSVAEKVTRLERCAWGREWGKRMLVFDF